MTADRSRTPRDGQRPRAQRRAGGPPSALCARLGRGLRSLMAKGSARLDRAWVAVACAGLAAGCQAPVGKSSFFYGAGEACTVDLSVPSELSTSLDPLRSAFDASSEVPRIVALLPHMGCEKGAEILRSEILDAHPDEDLRLIVIWQDTIRNGDERAASRATRYLQDPRVTAFFDCSGIAGRAFARGNLPVAEAREVFLFYPAGLRWPKDGGRDASLPRSARPVADAPPRTETWVHQLGRVAPERFCTPEELPLAIRLTVSRLLEDSARRARLRATPEPVAYEPAR